MGAHTSPSSSSASAAAPPRFVIGIDFGTTFSSVMWAHSSRPEENPVQTWRSHSADQVPTELHYTDPTTRTHVWGYEIQPTGRRAITPLRWFKLLLQDAPTSAPAPIAFSLSSSTTSNPPPPPPASSYNAPTTTPAHQTAAILSQLSIAPVTVVADFLRGLRTTTLASISNTLLGREFLSNSRFLYILTIPAIWSDQAKAHMISAAESAGYGKWGTDFHFVAEPEAAAAYTLKAIQPMELMVGDAFVILDCGGGTVDLVSYRIVGVDPLSLDECVAGTGDLCGSVFLDHGFEEYIRKKLGDSVIDGMSVRSRTQMMNSWINDVKFRFGNTTQIEFDVSVPGVADDDEKGVDSGFHTMRAEDVKAIFDPIIDRCIELTRAQVAAVQSKGQRVSAVLLVGGFGSSIYLRDRIKSASLAPNLEVLQPTNAHTAISRGALLRGLDGSIVRTKRLRRFYGCSASTPLSSALVKSPLSSLDFDRYKIWSKPDECYLVPGHMTWYVKRNDVISSSKTISFGFIRHVAVETAGFPMMRAWRFEDELLAFEGDGVNGEDAPDFTWRKGDVVSAGGLGGRSGRVYEVCQMVTDLEKVERSRWRKKWGSGKEWYVVEYELRLRIEGEILTFEMVVGGEVMEGGVRLKFRDAAGGEGVEVEVSR